MNMDQTVPIIVYTLFVSTNGYQWSPIGSFLTAKAARDVRAAVIKAELFCWYNPTFEIKKSENLLSKKRLEAYRKRGIKVRVSK